MEIKPIDKSIRRIQTLSQVELKVLLIIANVLPSMKITGYDSVSLRVAKKHCSNIIKKLKISIETIAFTTHTYIENHLIRKVASDFF